MLSKATLSIQPIVAKQPLIIPPLLLFNRTTSSTTTLLSIPPHTSTDQTNQTIHFTNTDTQHCHLSYSNLFSLLKCPPNLSEARRLHSLLLVGGFFTTNRVLGSQLVNVYVELGSFEEALLVFHKLPQKNNIAWNAILRGFVQVAQFSEAIEFYHLMLTQGIVPDNFTYPLILKACSGICALEEGKRVLELIRFNETSRGIKPNIYVECAMVDMFAKCGSLVEARMVFEEMPRKDLASWTAMICGTVQNGDWIGAFCFFRRMKLEGIRPDSLIVSGLLPACGRLEARKVGMGLQGCAVRSGFDSDLFVSNALMDMYCKCGKTREAYCVFCSMQYKDAVSWSTLIAGYSQNSQYRESVELYLEMKSNGVKTNAVSAASVLPGFAKLRMLKQGKEMHNYILKQGFESDIVVASALVDMYVNCHSTREAQHIFEIMSDRDITIWNSMIAGHAFSENFDLSFRIFRRIWESKLEPNSITLVSILPICTEVGSLKHGKEIHGYATRSGLGMVVSVGNSLIDMYCKNGCLELGVKVFNMMTVKNVVTYNTIISAHGIHGQGERALSFFDQMKAAKVRPNRVTFIGLLSACSHAGLIDRGWFFYNSMIDDYDMMPDMEHYSCMVDLLGRAGHLGDACNFIRGMPVEPDINVLGSLLGACRVHNKVELADFVGRQIFKKNSKDSGYHVLLANIYASTDRWEDVSKLRTMIKEKGLIKKPGKSWIDLGGCIHIFHARGTKHPEFNKIQETLGSLLLEMTNEGYKLVPSFLSNDLVGDGEEL
ncbi:putative pentatricopeptide repeat-containing protein At3g01580 [Cornus florida]|uniref:putative pentatricopeptide repeat-containing protein At3g01580 n=1 Tax=Cornus florida TaxID=4283 RepID=UPI00289AFE29|nr:putative pentatricopeptide repeat-containing protein At3g01580 [Cornus florida]